jgi:hypothetical protein
LWDYWHCGHSWPIVPASGDSEDNCGEQMECRLAGETEVLEENLPQRHFCPSQNPTCLGPVSNPDRSGGKLATNRLSYGAAQSTYKSLPVHTVDQGYLQKNTHN